MEKGKIEFTDPTFQPRRDALLDAARNKDRLGQIQNFEHLLELIEEGNLTDAKDWIRMAIKKLNA